MEYYSAHCRSTFSYDNDTVMQCTSLRQLYRTVLSALRYDAHYADYGWTDRTKWTFYAPDETPILTIAYLPCSEKLYCFRHIRRNGIPGQCVCFYVFKEFNHEEI